MTIPYAEIKRFRLEKGRVLGGQALLPRAQPRQSDGGPLRSKDGTSPPLQDCGSVPQHRADSGARCRDRFSPGPEDSKSARGGHGS